MASNGEEKTPEGGDGEMRSSDRSNRLSTLIQESRRSLISGTPLSHEMLGDMGEIDEEEELAESRQRVQQSLHRRFSVFQDQDKSRLVEVRLQNYSYHVPIRMGAPAVKTVMNQSICYGAYEFFHRMSQYCSRRGRNNNEGEARRSPRSSLWLPRTASDIINPYDSKSILSDINLVLKPGTTYLVLGPPGCGKTSLLKAIAGRLSNNAPKRKGADSPKDKAYQTGRVEYNGVSVEVSYG